MKPKLIALLLLLAVIALLYLVTRFSIAGDHTVKIQSTAPHNGLRIGVIGDSWAANKLDTILSNRTGATVYSYGQPGAKTKAIYEALLANKELYQKNLDYCIVVCGVNDAVGQVGAAYYATHLSLIAKQLQANHIQPIIVEMPEFGIIDYNNSFNFFKRYRNELFCTFTNQGRFNDIPDYRKALREKVKGVIIIPFDSVCRDYHSHLDLYSNPGHLSLKGNQKLVSLMVSWLK